MAQSATTKTILPRNISSRGTLNSCAFPNANASSITGESDRARWRTEAMGNNSFPAAFYFLRSIVRGTATGNQNPRSMACYKNRNTEACKLEGKCRLSSFVGSSVREGKRSRKIEITREEVRFVVILGASTVSVPIGVITARYYQRLEQGNAVFPERSRAKRDKAEARQRDARQYFAWAW